MSANLSAPTSAATPPPSGVEVVVADDLDLCQESASPLSPAPSASSPSAPSPTAAAPKLPAAEAYAWAAPSQGMARFHNSHKRTFTTSYDNAHLYPLSPSADPTLPRLSAFLKNSYNLVVHLGNHHAIEEAYIFPLLAHKHPAFRDHGAHKEDHALIHAGLEEYAEFLHQCLRDEGEYSADEMRRILDSFRTPLFRHLDQEVEDLRPDSLRKHGFTLAEVKRLPF